MLYSPNKSYFYKVNESGNKFKTPFRLLLITAFLVSLFSFVNTEFKIGKIKFRRIDFFSDLKFKYHKLNAVFPGAVFSDKIKDSLLALQQVKEKYAIVNFSRDTMGAMDMFYLSLIKSKQKKKITRIAYFGDSMIEGDLITEDLRFMFQKEFGGSGVGFVPVTSIAAPFRKSILHTFSNNWISFTLLDTVKHHKPLGLSGHVFYSLNEAFVSFQQPKYGTPFKNVKLYYGHSIKNNTVKINSPDTSYSDVLKGAYSVNELQVLIKNAKQLSFTFNCIDSLPVYGFSFESDNGVLLDNYSFRSNSGLPLASFKKNIVTDFNSYMNYDLIVLHYGLNVVAHNIESYSWYETGFGRVVDYFKRMFPNASILIIGLGDKSYKNEANEWETEPDVLKVLEVQKRIAQKKGVAFWNSYENMGGYNSMKTWVEGDVVYAGKDYTHINRRGAKRLADSLYNNIYKGYVDFISKQKGLSSLNKNKE